MNQSEKFTHEIDSLYEIRHYKNQREHPLT